MGARAGNGLVVEQDTLRCTVEILELAGSHAPQKSKKPESAKTEGDGDQEQENCHATLPAFAFTRPARKALSTTIIDELDMARAAMSGVTMPKMASGTAARL